MPISRTIKYLTLAAFYAANLDVSVVAAWREQA